MQTMWNDKVGDKAKRFRFWRIFMHSEHNKEVVEERDEPRRDKVWFVVVCGDAILTFLNYVAMQFI